MLFPEQVERAVAIATHFLESRYDIVPENYQVRLISRPEADAMSGCSDSFLGLWVIQERTVYLVQGRPLPDTVATVVHELTHVWHLDRCSGSAARRLVEGFAVWAQLKLMAESPTHYSQKARASLIRRKLPEYGEGLRLCLMLERDLGTAGLLDYVCHATDFPGEYVMSERCHTLFGIY